MRMLCVHVWSQRWSAPFPGHAASPRPEPVPAEPLSVRHAALPCRLPRWHAAGWALRGRRAVGPRRQRRGLPLQGHCRGAGRRRQVPLTAQVSRQAWVKASALPTVHLCDDRHKPPQAAAPPAVSTMRIAGVLSRGPKPATRTPQTSTMRMQRSRSAPLSVAILPGSCL